MSIQFGRIDIFESSRRGEKRVQSEGEDGPTTRSILTRPHYTTESFPVRLDV